MLAEFNGKVNAVLSIIVDYQTVVARILHRAQIEGRKDDTDRTIIERRIVNYREKTEPLIEYYRKRGNYYEIYGNNGIENTFEQISKLID